MAVRIGPHSLDNPRPVEVIVVVQGYHATGPDLFGPANEIHHDMVKRVVTVDKDKVKLAVFEIFHGVHACFSQNGTVVTR